MALSFTRPLRRAALLAAVSAVTAVVPLALTATPASAVTTVVPASVTVFNCNTFTSGGVTFEVCIKANNSTTAEAKIDKISGTFVSGSLRISKNGSQVASDACGKLTPGELCDFTHVGGTGAYKATWHSASGTNFDSPTI
jgi:hypothetical protein